MTTIPDSTRQKAASAGLLAAGAIGCYLVAISHETSAHSSDPQPWRARTRSSRLKGPDTSSLDSLPCEPATTASPASRSRIDEKWRLVAASYALLVVGMWLLVDVKGGGWRWPGGTFALLGLGGLMWLGGQVCVAIGWFGLARVQRKVGDKRKSGTLARLTAWLLVIGLGVGIAILLAGISGLDGAVTSLAWTAYWLLCVAFLVSGVALFALPKGAMGAKFAGGAFILGALGSMPGLFMTTTPDPTTDTVFYSLNAIFASSPSPTSPRD